MTDFIEDIVYYNRLLLPSASVCFALFHPCFLAVTVGLKEVQTFIAVVVVSI